jgi:membrane-associated protease RseP (regulator of RpoE activity)
VSSDLPPFQSTSAYADKPISNYPFRNTAPNPTNREWCLSVALFVATLLTTSYAGLFYSIGDIGILDSIRIFMHVPRVILHGLWFSIPLLLILLAHELGHFFACRYYGMRCTPPYFIPIPFPPAGTLGAFIKIKSHFPGKRALFDVGIAGPIAGFLLTLPALWIGISLSRLIPKRMIPPGAWSFGEPLIFRILGWLLLGYSPEKQDMIAHPLAIAAWVGLLATSINLLPIWQLDGGHIAYAVLGRSRHKILSAISVAALAILSLWDWSWRKPSYLLFAILLLIIGMRLRFYHPPTLCDEEKLDTARILLGLAALIILIISFMPVPLLIT